MKLEHISFKQRACIGAWNTILCAFFLLLFLCCFSSLKFHCFAVFAFNVNKDNSFNNVLQCLLLNKPHKKIFVYNVLYVNMNYPSFVCFFLFLLYLTRKNCSFYHRTLLRLEASIYWKSLKTSTHVLNE